MIKIHEGLGGWTIEVKNGKRIKKFECANYIVKDKHGTNWFDFDQAMRDAEKYNREIQSEQAT